MKYLNTTIFLCKDKSYKYLLSGNKLILCPLGHGKVRECVLSDDEVSHIMDCYITPIQELQNKHPNLVDVIDDILDYEDDLRAYIIYEVLDALVK